MHNSQSYYNRTPPEPPQRPFPSTSTLRSKNIFNQANSGANHLERKARVLPCRCGYQPTGKGGNRAHNYKRHKETCNRPLVKNFRCGYPGCDKSYTRFDNLKVHRKAKKHFTDVDLLIEFTTTSPRVEESIAGKNELELGKSEPPSYEESQLVTRRP
jgi:hypothetical protein